MVDMENYMRPIFNTPGGGKDRYSRHNDLHIYPNTCGNNSIGQIINWI